MKNLVLITICYVLGLSIILADVPKSGKFSITSGLKMEYTPTKQSEEGHMQGPFTVVGVSFNDKGKGLFHKGTFNCSASAMGMPDGTAINSGYCTIGDSNGKIFFKFTGEVGTDFVGKGKNIIVGGTGAYKGITGEGPWNCSILSANGSLLCEETFTYKIK